MLRRYNLVILLLLQITLPMSMVNYIPLVQTPTKNYTVAHQYEYL